MVRNTPRCDGLSRTQASQTFASPLRVAQSLKRRSRLLLRLPPPNSIPLLARTSNATDGERGPGPQELCALTFQRRSVFAGSGELGVNEVLGNPACRTTTDSSLAFWT